ncbi:MAG: protein kinase [Bacteroidota bacterium]
MIGQTISHYKILEKLGEGGMGIVYKAEDTRLHRMVAIKILPTHLAVHGEERERFTLEAQAASAINNPNICTIYEIDETNDDTFIVMEYVEGSTVREWIQKKLSETEGFRKTGLTEAIHLAIQIAEGLDKAHEKGIVHRDIKSENVMVTPDGRAKIMDFGLAKLRGVSKLTKVGSTVGTLAYMSPEQIEGLETDHRTDIFSFGVLLYEMITGKLPFLAAHEAAIMYEIINVVPQQPSQVRQTVDLELDRIVMKCMEKNRDERYQSLKEVVVDLRRFSRDSSGKTMARPATMSDHAHQNKSASSPRSSRTNIAAIAGSVILISASLSYYYFTHHPSSIDSLAVLPFVNASPDSSMEYLSDGITESLINSLSQLPDLKVMSRNSVFRYKGSNADLQTIGREVGVHAILLGRVLERGDNLSISAELINVSDNSHLWGEQYNRKSADLLAVQEEITRDISDKLKLRLADKDEKHSAKASTENTEAYQLYLKGRYHWNRRSADELRKAIDYFQQAVESDPNYALAYSGIADAYGVLGWFEYGIVSPRDAFPKAKAAALKAVAIDPGLAEGYASLAFAYQHDHDTLAASQNYKRAIELNPSYPTAHHWYSEELMSEGKKDESIEEIKRALTLDPLSLIITRDVGWMYYFARRYDEASVYIQKSLDLDSNFSRGHLLLGLCRIQQGALGDAITEFKTASKFSNETISTALLAYCYAKAGKTTEAKDILRSMLSLSSSKYVSPGAIALVYMGLGDREKIFEWLNKAVDDQSGIFGFVKVDPLFDGIRNDPQFVALLHKGGIPL